MTLHPSLIFWLFVWSHKSVADTNKFLKMSSLCSEKYLPYTTIDGAVLTSEEDLNAASCTVTFQTNSILDRLMLRFERLLLNCDTHMNIFDGAHAFGKPKVMLSCGKNESQVGTINMQTNFVTLKYTTGSTFRDSGFKLIITSYRLKPPAGASDKHHCAGFNCRATSFCISSDLECDGVNHCGDDSDEADECANNEKTTSEQVPKTSPDGATSTEIPTMSTIASVQSTLMGQESDTNRQETPCEALRGGKLDMLFGSIGIPTYVCRAGYFVYNTIKSCLGY